MQCENISVVQCLVCVFQNNFMFENFKVAIYQCFIFSIQLSISVDWEETNAVFQDSRNKRGISRLKEQTRYFKTQETNAVFQDSRNKRGISRLKKQTPFFL